MEVLWFMFLFVLCAGCAAIILGGLLLLLAKLASGWNH